jgi:hypothetical protein
MVFAQEAAHQMEKAREKRELWVLTRLPVWTLCLLSS